MIKKSNMIYNCDYRIFLNSLQDESVILSCFDPPYNTIKHEIETGIDTDELFFLLEKKMAVNSFVVFFCQMPSMIDFCTSAAKYFKFQDHIVWAKRSLSSPYLQLVRTHEDIMIYRKGSKKFVETKGKYDDIKTNQITTSMIQVHSLQRQMQELRARSKGKVFKRVFNSTINDHYHSKYKGSNDSTPEFCNLSNTWSFELTQREFDSVWSFAPQNKVNFNKIENNYKHPTVKPIKLVEQLIRLCSSEGDLVIDPFVGTGTTAVACKNTFREFSGSEIFEKYYNMTINRLKFTTKKLML